MDIRKYLNDQGVAFETYSHPAAYTAQEVAAEEHVSGRVMAKTVLVHDESGYAICVLPACCMLDMDKVAGARKSRQLRLADETELADVFPDTEVGAEPPFGNLYNLPTLVDEKLSDQDEIVFQAGTHRQAIRMRYDDYAALAEPQVLDLATHL